LFPPAGLTQGPGLFPLLFNFFLVYLDNEWVRHFFSNPPFSFFIEVPKNIFKILIPYLPASNKIISLSKSFPLGYKVSIESKNYAVKEEKDGKALV
jgi:hypothetical protein